MESFLVRFWGVRGSYPVPGEQTVRFGGNTPCLELQMGEHVIIIDAGTGIINLGYDMMRRAQEQGNAPVVATILLTHLHHDHTQGFPFFLPAYLGSSMLHLFGPHTFEQRLEEELGNVVLTPNFPVNITEMPSFQVIRTVRETEMLLIGPDTSDVHVFNIHHEHVDVPPDVVRVRIHRGYAHPKNGVFIYRVEWGGRSVVFASDTEGYLGTDQRLVRFARDTDVLIHDAQYTTEEYLSGKQGWGHSTIEMACDVARQCGAKQLVLFHHDPGHHDDMVAEMERTAQKLFPQTIAAYEGLEIIARSGNL